VHTPYSQITHFVFLVDTAQRCFSVEQAFMPAQMHS
jgi:hypothetical protein